MSENLKEIELTYRIAGHLADGGTLDKEQELPMTLDRKDFLSLLIKPNGQVVPAMPHEEEFSVQQIRDHVAGYAELICETSEGFLLFRNRDARTKGLPPNPLATSLSIRYAPARFPVNGHAFLAHPDHVAPYWRRGLETGTRDWKQAA